MKKFILTILLSLLFVNQSYADQTFIGIASWYGLHSNGNLTASGIRFSMYKPIAASRTLPLHSIIKVINLKNNKSIILPVLDRGPYVKGRIIDLSFIAAKKLGYIKQGITPVKIIVLYNPKINRKHNNNIFNSIVLQNQLTFYNTLNYLTRTCYNLSQLFVI